MQLKGSPERLIVIALLLFLGILGATLATNWPSFEIDSDLSANAYDILLKYIFLIIVFERSIAVYNAVRFENPKLTATRKIKNFREKKKLYDGLDATAKEKYSDNDRT